MTEPFPLTTRAPRAVMWVLWLWLAASTATAQTVDTTDGTFGASQGGDLPPYVVPVLRLVSSTHVEPTTGLVLTESGLVLVPGGFASAGDEVVVLDGGTDIVANGRTARIERELPMDGLQVLSVYGLRRSPAPFADTGLADGDSVRLRAFPPAEQIAEGAAPLDVPSTVTVFGEGANPAIAGDSALPNVTGPLLDGCGNVAAYSVANDIQSMASSPGTRYRWRATLLDVMGRLGAIPAPSACAEPVVAEEEEAPEETEAQPPEPASETAEPIPEPVTPEAEQAEEELATEGEDAADTAQEPEVPELDILPPIESGDVPDSTIDAPPEEPGRHWGWLLLAGLFIATGVGLHVWRRRLRIPAEPKDGEAATAPLLPDTGHERAGADATADSRLRVEGRFSDGRPLSLSCPVNREAINVVIGRGQVELRIDSAAVSRRHAALNGTADALTLTDLGSSNGTMLNGVPCMEGEIFFVEDGDTLVLGDARFTIELVPNGEAFSR